MTWIAFGKAVPVPKWRDDLPEMRSRQQWGYNPPDSLLPALQAHAAGQAWRPDAALRRKTPFCLWRYRATVRKLVRETGLPAHELVAQLQDDIRRAASFETEMEAAQSALVAAVRNEHLEAWGRPARGDWQPMPGAEHISLPSLLFHGPRTIDWDGWLREDTALPLGDWLHYHHDGRYFDEIRFWASDVVSLWPSRSSGTVPAEVTAWMEENVVADPGGHPPKRDGALLSCRKATGCTNREALEGWNALPADRKNRRGAPKKVTG